MRNHKKLLLEQLDRKLQSFKVIEHIQLPEKGWINTIRISLNMTLEQLGNKLNITRQGMKKIEEREASGAITIKILKEVGKELDLKFVYGFVPNHGTIEDMVDKRARQLAKTIVLRTNQNMKLENQGNSDEQIIKAINELSSEIKREMSRSLWD